MNLTAPAARPAAATATPDRRRTRWDAHREARREALLDAAVRAIRASGPGVGMDEIAATAGTSKTVVYRHFADKDALYLAVCARVADRLTAELAAVLEGERDSRRLLADAVDVYLRVIEADPHVYRFVVHRPLPATAATGDEDPVAGLSALVGEHVAGLIETRLCAAGLPTDGAGPWGHGLVGMVRAAADHWLDSGAGTDRERLRDHLTELAWGGLAGLTRLAPPGPTDDATEELA